jgi:hypothetical protein
MHQQTLAAEQPSRRATGAPTFVSAFGVFILAFLYRLPDATGLVNDHFMHVAWGRQLLWERLPVRDAVSLGMPLQTGLSAASEWIFGYRLLSEAVIISTAFAAAAALTFVLVRRATGSTAVAIMATLLEVAIAPRTYSYPKLIVYAAGILLLWRYIDQPSSRRAVQLGIATAIAFYLRHDHGLYLGVITMVVIAMRHGRTRGAIQQASVFAATCVILVLPFFAYVEAYGSVRDYARDMREFSARERSGNPFVWPSWPLSSIDGVARWTSPKDRAVSIAIRWSSHSSDDVRRQVAARYHIAVPPAGAVESGRFLLYDASTANASALIRDPVIEDTAGIDRVTAEVYVPGWYVGPVRVLEALDAAPASAALLFFAFLALSAASCVVLLQNRLPSGPLGRWERLKMAAVLLVAMLTFAGFVREALDVRIGDAVVAPAILGGWLAARWLSGGSTSWRRAGRIAVLLVIMVPLSRSVVVAGALEPRMERAEPLAVTWRQLTTSPPFDAWPARGSADYRVVQYVRECTGPREPLLVLWFAPEFYYYADRPFAGRMGAYMNGYYTSAENQVKNAAALQRDRPAVAILEAGRELNDLAAHTAAQMYLAAHYHELGTVPATDGTVLRVFGRNDRQATSTDGDLGWPCYR